MTLDNTSKGIFLTMIAMTMFAMQDSLIKYIFEKSSLYEILWTHPVRRLVVISH